MGLFWAHVLFLSLHSLCAVFGVQLMLLSDGSVTQHLQLLLNQEVLVVSCLGLG